MTEAAPEAPVPVVRGRRTGVSAEADMDDDEDFEPPEYEKDDEQTERILKAVKNNILFSHLDEDQMETIALAMDMDEKRDGEERRLGERVEALHCEWGLKYI